MQLNVPQNLPRLLPRRSLIVHPLLLQIRTSKVLCIGAGGIGCELLKTLVMTGFEDIELVRCRSALVHPSTCCAPFPVQAL